MSKEIILSRNTIRAFIWILIAAVSLLGLGLILRSHPVLASDVVNQILGVTPTAMTDPEDARAAIAGVNAFYSLDYTVPVGTWEEAVCATLTPAGCEVFKGLYAPGLRSIVEKNQWQTNCTARALQLVEEDTDRRVWRLEATLDQPLPESPAVFLVYAEVARDPGGPWKMTHVLNEGEAGRFASTAP